MRKKIKKSRNIMKGKMGFDLNETMISYKETSVNNDVSLRELNSFIDIKVEQENQIDIKNLANNFEELDFDKIELGKENINKVNKLTTNKVAIENDLNKLKKFDFEILEKIQWRLCFKIYCWKFEKIKK